MRQIAERARVTATMLNRCFGSKDRLFAQAVERASAPPTVVRDRLPGLADSVARTLAERTGPGAEQLDRFLLLLQSAADPEAVDIVRQGIETHVGVRLAGLLDSSDAEVRAQLGLAVTAGTWLLRTVIGTTALASADNDQLADILADMLRPVTRTSGLPQPPSAGPDGADG
ncbi:AcrR family transcriptional regulator [Streptomyces sp. SAI-135]|nr:AcrR family transcriptional regulator [Streptomyces sp. SAI-090]MDH6621559.1 AcrR family transcriptional regulator [Streptomyces sp. SAI-135]